jgi:anti-sigma regulatory factor (Ser/Thr protein kinase)
LVAHLEKDLAGTVALDDAVLAVTELVTNAINAGSQQIVVDVDLHRDHLVLAVADDAPGLPEVQEPEQFSTHGRGLHIIDTLARRWGTERQSIGKRVWAELPVDPTNSSSCRLA